MYEDQFGSDWEQLTREAAIRRAYALGVSASLGVRLDDEYERIYESVESAYDRSIVQLAYEEGENRARKLKAGSDDEDVWDELVDPGDDEVTEIRITPEVPSALTQLDLLDSPGDDLDALRLPKFLVRED